MRRNHPCVALLTLALLTAATAPALAAPPQYTLEVLEGSAVHIDGINNHGEVVGWTTVAGNVRAYVAGPSHPHELLPLPPGYVSSWAKDINDLGTIVGSVGQSFTPEFGQAVAWTPAAGGGHHVEFLGALPGHTQSVAMAVNNLGDIVGYSINPGFQGGPTVWFNAPGGVLNLSALGAPSSPQQISEERVVCGWNGGLFDLDDLVAQPLPGDVPANWIPFTWAINDHGSLAGYTLVGGASRFATRYTESGGWEQIGNTVDPSVLATAYDINNDGTVVVETSIPGFGWGVGAAFASGELIALEELLAPGQGNWAFVANLGEAINDQGQIASFAEDLDGGPDGLVLLTPVETSIPCEDIRTFRGRCSLTGSRLGARVTLQDTSHDGETVSISVDGVPHIVEISGRQASYWESASPGMHVIELTDPQACFPEVVVTCP